MSERYWITGVQLGVLMSSNVWEHREKLCKQVIDNQFLGSSKDLRKRFRAVQKK